MLNNSSFNALANSYDTDFTHSIIGTLQRKKVWKYLEENIDSKRVLNILEINCGTGEDALWLTSKGQQVVATDISEQMIEVAKQKAIIQKVNIKPLVCSFVNLATRLNGQKFDMIFSNFGGLNCSNNQDLTQLNHDFAQLLKPKGLLIMVLLGKNCFLENLYFLMRFNFKKLNRRKQATEAYLSDDNFITTWYYNYQEIAKIFNLFQLKQKKPIGLFIPPSYLEPLIQKNKLLLPVVKWLENAFGNIGFLANYSDHIYIEMKLK
ncbi:MAG: class I SAM-dependent methyltransferase [Bacteroidota bacterium]